MSKQTKYAKSFKVFVQNTLPLVVEYVLVKGGSIAFQGVQIHSNLFAIFYPFQDSPRPTKLENISSQQAIAVSLIL